MGIARKRILTACGVFGAMGLTFVGGAIVSWVQHQSSYYDWLRAESASRAHYKISIAASLRSGEVQEVIEDMETDAILDLWCSSRNYWKKTPLRISRWSEDTIKLWQEAKNYYEQHPAAMNRDRPTNIREVRELLRQIPALERDGLERDFPKVYHGKTPPALHIAKWMGPAMTLEDLRGEVVLLDFWHTECPGCITRMPRVQEVHDRFNERGLKVLAIHSARAGSFAEVPEFLRTHQYSFSVGLDDRLETETNYAVQAWPTYYLIDAQGHLAWGPGHDVPGDEILLELLNQRR